MKFLVNGLKLFVLCVLPLLSSCERCAECEFYNCYDCTFMLMAREEEVEVCADNPAKLQEEVEAREFVGYKCAQNNSTRTIDYCSSKKELDDWKAMNEKDDWTCIDVD